MANNKQCRMAVIVDAACGIFILFQPANEAKKTGIPFRVQHTISHLHKNGMQYSGLMMKKISRQKYSERYITTWVDTLKKV